MKGARLLSKVLLAALLWLFAAQLARAQSSITGLISGSVVDPSGVAVPQAAVTLRSATSGCTTKVLTGADARYQFPYTAPGTYTLSMTATGFAEVHQAVIVTVGQTTSADFHLGAAVTSVQVLLERPGVLQQRTRPPPAVFKRQSVGGGARRADPQEQHLLLCGFRGLARGAAVGDEREYPVSRFRAGARPTRENEPFDRTTRRAGRPVMQAAADGKQLLYTEVSSCEGPS